MLRRQNCDPAQGCRKAWPRRTRQSEHGAHLKWCPDRIQRQLTLDVNSAASSQSTYTPVGVEAVLQSVAPLHQNLCAASKTSNHKARVAHTLKSSCTRDHLAQRLLHCPGLFSFLTCNTTRGVGCRLRSHRADCHPAAPVGPPHRTSVVRTDLSWWYSNRVDAPGASLCTHQCISRCTLFNSSRTVINPCLINSILSHNAKLIKLVPR
jgi:hypothetical protein